MITRSLDPAEYPRLAGTEAETLWPHLNPKRSEIIVVEEGEEILGCHALVEILHVEALWIHPHHRTRVAVPRKLWAAVQAAACARGFAAVATAAVSDDVRQLLAHVGAVPLPGDHYSVRLMATDNSHYGR